MVFNATFNNISVISWRSVLLPEKCGGPGENHWPAASHWQTLSEETGVPGENHRPVASHWHKGNWCTRRKPQTCHKSLTNFITLGKAEYTEKTTDLPQVTDKRYQKPRTSHKSLTNFYHIMLSTRSTRRKRLTCHKSLTNRSLSTIFQLYRGGQFYWWRTGVPGENHRTVSSHWQTLYHMMLYRVHPSWTGLELITLVVVGTDCTCSCKSNYHTITTTTATDPLKVLDLQPLLNKLIDKCLESLKSFIAI